jgi:hypothetical protein
MKSLIPLRVVTNQYLGEGRAKGFNRLLKSFAAFEVEFVLSTPFRRAAGDGSIFNCIAENCTTELFVNQNPGLSFGSSAVTAAMKAS